MLTKKGQRLWYRVIKGSISTELYFPSQIEINFNRLQSFAQQVSIADVLDNCALIVNAGGKNETGCQALEYLWVLPICFGD